MATVPDPGIQKENEERTKPVVFRRVRIQGYKSISFCDVQLKPLTVIVGRNGSGKSNFLDALAFLRDLMQLGVIEAVQRRGGWHSMVSRSSKAESISMEIELSLPFIEDEDQATHSSGTKSVSRSGRNIPYSGSKSRSKREKTYRALFSVVIHAQANQRPTIAKEHLVLQTEEGGSSGGFEITGDQFKSDPVPSGPSPNGLTIDPNHSPSLLLQRDHLFLSTVGHQPFIDVVESVRTIGLYHFSPDSMRTLQRPIRGRMLERDGRNLASALADLCDNDPNKAERLREYLSAIVGERIDFYPVVYGEYETVQFRQGHGDHPLVFDAAAMSDGTLRALAALVAAFQIPSMSKPSLIGIEEPETALHPVASQALVDALSEATGHAQMILTTHSADLLEAELALASILVVRNRQGQTLIGPVDQASKEIVQKGLYTIADLQRMDQLDIDQEDLDRQQSMSAAGDQECR